MTDSKPGFAAQIKSYPRTFWVANTMEIFERMAWYGFFAVSSLYITGPRETGGLGFTSEQRGQIQAIVPFFLYLMPVLTGALADRYGYKKMFTIAYVGMIVFYYALGQFKTMPTFLAAFMCVAVAAAIFKPVVVGTVARVTNEGNSSMGFGIFYMMVNVGGFVGPIVAGILRGISWDKVFLASSAWALINLIIVTLFYKEPTTEAASGKGRTLRTVLENAVEVLGNLRFFITVFVVLIGLLLANQKVPWFRWWPHCVVFVPAWIVLNFVWDALLPSGSGRPEYNRVQRRSFLLKRMHCSNWRFALFLLIMSGFWTAFNQIFLTMPEYIRDFTETRPLIRAAEAVFGKSPADDPDTGTASKVATINAEERAEIAKKVDVLLTAQAAGRLDQAALEQASRALLESKVRLRPASLGELVRADGATRESVTKQAILLGRQFNPEFIININAGGIVLFQVLVSFLMGRFHRFTTMIVGMVVAAVGIGLSTFAGDHGMLGPGGLVWLVAGGILIFSFGEMMASPTSQEYVGRIAPRDRVAVYMGYYFIAVALGNLFGGILSGQMYATLARDMQRPDLMWIAFAALMLLTAFVFLLYDRFALPRSAPKSA